MNANLVFLYGNVAKLIKMMLNILSLYGCIFLFLCIFFRLN